MTEHAPDRIWSGIEISKVAAGTLAAVSAAVIGSFLGVAGTLIGAAIASVIGSVGTEVYQRSINKGAKKLQTLAPTFIKAPAAVGTPDVAAATEDDAPSHSVAPEEVSQHRAEVQPRTKLRWKPILLGSAVVFLIAMGAIFAVEAIAGRSLASVTGNADPGKSSIGVPVRKSVETTPSPIPTTPAPSATSDPAGAPASEDPARDQSAEPSATPTSTGDPTTDEPEQTPPTDTQPGDQNDQQPRNDEEQQPDQGTE